MGFLSPINVVVRDAIADVMNPPDPPNITKWCEENIEFDARSPIPGKFNMSGFEFLREIHEVLSPEHPCREVTIKGSAQLGKTVSIIQPTLGAWFSYTPLDALVVHPTASAASEWVDNKWSPMRRQAPDLIRMFGTGRGDNKDSLMNQETVARNGSLKVASAGSPADLTGTSRRLVIMDDLSKWEMLEKGDPEALAVSRASGFEDAKIARLSTPMIKGTCRISRAYDRSDKRLYYVPCPHCGNKAPLTWDNFKKSIDPERLHAAHFTCESCGCVIDHSYKAQMIANGEWRGHNKAGDHPGFFIWRAYAPQRDWASIAIEYAQVMGWTRQEKEVETETSQANRIEARTEQTFFNDVLGLDYEQATGGPDWEELRDRTELKDATETLPVGVLPATGFMLTAGVDCQDDRTEMHLVAYGRNRKRWAIDYKIIPHHIEAPECWAALDSYLKNTPWKTDLGLPVGIDMLAIDGGTYTTAVWNWAKRHPWSRVIVVKGSSSQNGPILRPMKYEQKKDATARRRQKRGFMLNVSQLKGEFYTALKIEDMDARTAVSFARGFTDEYYRQISSEVKTLTRLRSGVTVAKWDLVEPGRRNEGLDTMNYSEAAARRFGWDSYTEEQWDLLEAERSQIPKDDQRDLFDKNILPSDAKIDHKVNPTQKLSHARRLP